MAFITLRRSRNTLSYYLVESYRDEAGLSRKRTICYLGGENDGTDTLAKAVLHWQGVRKAARRELRNAVGTRRRILRDRVRKAEARVTLLRRYEAQAVRLAAERLERQRRQLAVEEARRRRAEEAEHWRAIERLHQEPSADHAHAAKRAYRFLAMRLHPDQGGTHEAFIRLKAAYDRTAETWRRRAG